MSVANQLGALYTMNGFCFFQSETRERVYKYVRIDTCSGYISDMQITHWYLKDVFVFRLVHVGL